MSWGIERLWLRLLVWPLLAALVAMLLSGFVPPTYTARSQVVLRLNPPPGTEAISPRLAAPTLGFYAALLQSRRLNERIVHHFGLQQAYREATLSGALQRLGRRVRFGSVAGQLIIEASDVYPWRAADMANQYVIELRRLLDEMRIERARRRADGLSAMLQETTQRLATVQRELAGSGIDHAVLRLDRQYAAGHYLGLQQALQTAELALQGLKLKHRPASIEIQQQQARIAALDAELRRAQGQQVQRLGATPDHASAHRDMRRLDALLKTLRLQLTAARTDEGYATEALLLIDRAAMPERRSGPNTLLFMLAAWLTASASVLGRHLWRRARAARGRNQTSTRSIPP